MRPLHGHRHADPPETGAPASTSALFLLACGIALSALPSVASAQINPFANYQGPVLSGQDLSIGKEAARKLLQDDKASVGRVEEWNNPATGRHGIITVLDAFQRRGMDCRSIESRVEYQPPTPSRAFALRFCRLPSGEWKLQ